MKLTQAQIRRKIETAIEKESSFVAGCKAGSQRDNPQVIEMRLKAEGRIDALEAVRDAMRGDTVFLNIICGE